MLSPIAIAIVNTSNCPLLIRTSLDDIDKEEATKLIYLLHASLDIVEEKCEQPTTRENFLGVLYQCEQYKIYGLMSTTKVKVLLMINQRYNINVPRENDVRQMLKGIHRAYVDATAMNPFYKPNEPVKSKRLDSYLDTIFANTANDSNSVATGGTAASSAGSQTPVPGTNQVVQTV